MSPIELNSIQKSKLLEMCKVLFSEQNWHFWESEEESYPNGMLGYSRYAILGKHKAIQPSLEIHWFEFCTKIGYKIFSKKENWYNSEEFKTFMRIMCMQDKTKLSHPIDYLYEQFKQLK